MVCYDRHVIFTSTEAPPSIIVYQSISSEAHRRHDPTYPKPPIDKGFSVVTGCVLVSWNSSRRRDTHITFLSLRSYTVCTEDAKGKKVEKQEHQGIGGLVSVLVDYDVNEER